MLLLLVPVSDLCCKHADCQEYNRDVAVSDFVYY